jgi:transcriptional regulator with PAS, ATPase and Fis domain
MIGEAPECIYRFSEIITQNKLMMSILNTARNIARSKATILIQGESGTGKELLAGYIHLNSGCKGPYIAVNCAALPETLAESELFGHEKGAFTGAIKRKLGKFELAHNGSIVLDEITELNMALQAKLLRVLQEKKIDRVGGDIPVSIDYRLIAISNIEIKQAVLEERFREDLYYRINVIPLTIPPLRERKDDILLLANRFIDKYASRYGREIRGMTQKAVEMIMSHCWKGNVRELENAVERAVLLSETKIVECRHLFIEDSIFTKNKTLDLEVGVTLKNMEKKLICKTLEDVNENRTRAAEKLGISIRTLRNKLKEYKEIDKECQKVSIP